MRIDDGQRGSNPRIRVADNPGTTPFVDTIAFVGTNPTDEPIAPGLLLTQNPAMVEVCWWDVLVCSPPLAAAQGVMAMTRRGLPEPPTIFSGAAMTMAPVGGS